MRTATMFYLSLGLSLLCVSAAQGMLVYSIGDYVWFDANQNGIQDADEQGIDNVEVQLFHEGSQIRSMKTFTGGPLNAPGYYLFDQLPVLAPEENVYTVRVNAGTLPAGHVPTVAEAPGSTSQNDSDNPEGTVVTLSDFNPDDMTIDFGYITTGRKVCIEDPSNPGGVIQLGTLTTYVDPTTKDVTVVFEESTSINDNSYGTNVVGWPRSHNFSDLVGSDKAEFRFVDQNKNVVFDFALDYISKASVTPDAPSGYKSLGATGGDGKVLVGQASWLTWYSTSLAENLNDPYICPNGNGTVNGVNLLVNSPPTVASNSYELADPAFEGWQFPIVYSVTVSHQAFSTAEFGDVTLASVHNSPSKIGTNAFSEVPCEPEPSSCSVCKGGVTQLTLQYTATKGSAVPIVVYEGTKVSATKLFEGSVAPTGQFTFTGKQADGTMGTSICISVSGKINTTITTNCSKPIGPGAVYGKFKVIEGYSRDGGLLCAVK